MNMSETIALVLTGFLLCGKPALAANDRILPESTNEWMLFIWLCMMTLLLLVTLSFLAGSIYLCIRGHYYCCGVTKKLDEEYEFLSTDEKDTISRLEMEIDKTLDVYRPGIAKYSDAWRAWSKEDGGIALMKRGLFTIHWKNGYSPYEVVENAMSKTESAMRMEKKFKAKLEREKTETIKERLAKLHEKAASDKEKYRRIAAMLWGIWWQAEVKRKMEGEKKYRDAPTYEV